MWVQPISLGPGMLSDADFLYQIHMYISQHQAPLNNFLDSDPNFMFSPADILGVFQTTIKKALYKLSLLKLL